MIKLDKSPCPQVLTDNKDSWTRELLEALSCGDTLTTTQKTRYNHRDIKDALVAETFGKCAYCESKIRHIDHGDIEHVLPKSKRPEVAFSWVNLTLSCRVCNRNKGDYLCEDDDHAGLIDPYQDQPREHFLFNRELVTPLPNSMRAIQTDQVIKISRNELVERRKEKLDFLDGLITAYINAEERYKNMLYRNIVQLCVGKDKEYSATLAVYLQIFLDRGIITNSD